MKQVKDYIRDLDEIYPPSSTSLHFQGDRKQKTFIGGLASFGVTLFVLYFCYDNGKRMFGFGDPALSSLAEKMKYDEVGQVKIGDVAKILFEILEDGDTAVDLEAVEGGYKQYVDIRLNNKEKKWNPDTKSFDVKDNYYDL